MKQILPMALFCTFLEQGIAQQPRQIPSLQELRAVVGLSSTSVEVKKIIGEYNFGKNPKRDGSWGSFGVFLELAGDKIQVGLRPASKGTNMSTYSSELPSGLMPGDSIEQITAKLGKPLKTVHDPKAYYEMTYQNLAVYNMRGELFEIWLLPAPETNVKEPTAVRQR